MITGTIKDNKFIPDYPEQFINEFSKREGKQVKLEVKTLGYKGRQYAFLYGVVYQTFKNELGYNSLNDVDTDLKELFFFEHKENKLTGAVEKKLKSKSIAGKDELSKFISDCVLYGNTEYGFNILNSQEYFENQLTK